MKSTELRYKKKKNVTKTTINVAGYRLIRATFDGVN